MLSDAPVEMRHHNIQYHEIQGGVFEQHQSVNAVVCSKTGVTAAPQIDHNDVLHLFFILHYQYVRHPKPSSCGLTPAQFPALSYTEIPF